MDISQQLSDGGEDAERKMDSASFTAVYSVPLKSITSCCRNMNMFFGMLPRAGHFSDV